MSFQLIVAEKIFIAVGRNLFKRYLTFADFTAPKKFPSLPIKRDKQKIKKILFAENCLKIISQNFCITGLNLKELELLE